MLDLEIAEVRSRLLKLRQDLESLEATSGQSSQVVELDQARVGRLSRMDALQAQAMSVASGRRRKVLLRSIDAALERVDSGEYGLCQSCGNPINHKRLDFDPAALLCIECAQRAEKSE